MRWFALVALVGCGRIDFDPTANPGSIEAARGSISVGDGFACAIRDRGEIWCWGENGARELAIADHVPRFTPERVVGVPAATLVSAGDHHACALVTGGKIWCWGDNDSMQVGPMAGLGFVAPPMEGVPEPLLVALPGPALDVAAGGHFTCAVLETGDAWCWGSNENGQLGLGSTDTDKHAPAKVPGVSGLTNIATDDDSACALAANGHIWCWGENGRGHVADPPSLEVPTPTERVGITTATTIDIGGDHTCAIVSGELECWGNNDWGALGNGSDEGVSTPVFPLPDVVEAELAFVGTCAIQSTGQLWCWGRNSYGLLGVGDAGVTEVNSPTMTPISDAIAVSTSSSAMCAIRATGDIACAGYGPRGQLGDGRSAIAAPVSLGITAAHIAVGFEHSCSANGTSVECWGNNGAGQLGVGTGTASHSMLVMPAGVAQLALMTSTSCARLVDGVVKCWGLNNSGQVGNNSGTSELSPVTVPMPRPATALVAGEDTACTLLDDATVWCWGDNYNGMVGNGSPDDQPVPVQVESTITEIVAGDRHICVRRATDVWCWGDNEIGQLGNGNDPTDLMTSSGVPIMTGVQNLGGLATLSGAGWATCAVGAGGVISCWGYNAYGILGLTTNLQSTPAVSTATTLYARSRITTCEADACWGAGRLGMLGTGTLDDQQVPTPIIGLPGGAPSAYALGEHHSCAINMGSVWCWGYNSHGEVSFAQPRSDADVPVTVKFP